MEDHTKRSTSWRVIPFLLIMLALLVTGGIALAGVAAGVPAGTAGPPVQTKGDAKAKHTQKDNPATALSNAGLSNTGPEGKSSDTTNSPEVYVNKSPEPVATDRHASAATANFLYILGGEYFSGAFAITSTVQRYDRAADSWQFMAPMPAALSNHEACTMNGK